MLHVISGLHLGGAETLLYRLATRHGTGVEHQVICLGDRQWYSALLEQHGVPVHHLGMTHANFPVTLFHLRKALRQSGADVVQSWLYVANVLSGMFARPAGIPVVWGIHASTLEHVGRVSRLCAIAGGMASPRLADFVVNCSSRSAVLHSRLGYGAIPSAVIHNGYDPDFFFPDDAIRAGFRKSLGVADETFLIGTVGRWHPQKDIPNLLRAIRLLRERNLPVICALVGGGLDATNTELLTEIRAAGCENEVLLLGPQTNVRDCYRAMDLHVLASSGSEAFPNVVAESMLCGTPDVVTEIGDSAIIVGDTGWVVPPRESAKLADAIDLAGRERSSTPGKWAQRRQAARQRIAEQFTFDRMADAYAQVWRTIAQKRH